MWGFVPARRGTFVSAKGPKTISACAWLLWRNFAAMPNYMARKLALGIVEKVRQQGRRQRETRGVRREYVEGFEQRERRWRIFSTIPSAQTVLAEQSNSAWQRSRAQRRRSENAQNNTSPRVPFVFSNGVRRFAYRPPILLDQG